MNFEKAKKLLTQLSVFYFLLAAMIFFVAGDGFRHEIVNGSALSPSSVIGEIVDGMVVEQRLPLGADHVEALNLQVATFGRQNTGILHVDIYGEDGTLISSAQGRLEDMGDNQVIRFSFAESLDGMRKQYSTVKIWSEGCQPGNAPFITETAFRRESIRFRRALHQKICIRWMALRAVELCVHILMVTTT